MIDDNIFAGAFVDRSGHLRKDPDWLERAVHSDNSCFVPVWRDKCLLHEEQAAGPASIILLNRKQAEPWLDDDNIIFLGMFRDRPAFAVNAGREEPPPYADAGVYHDLRYLGSVLPADEANLVAHARALVVWHRRQKFCGRCGSPTIAAAGGNNQVCTNPECGFQVFPRVDPAIIVLVSDRDRCLLGRQASWPEGRYSTIAGFAEPGESLEDAVRREVHEETNIQTRAVRYHSSQPWPFPSSLMIGFTADAESADIVLNDGELEDAQWFTRKELRSGFPKLPMRLSIARRLVDYWLNEE